MKVLFLLLFFIITIEYIQSENILRTFIIVRDRSITYNKRLSNYTIYDSTEKKLLYRIKTISTDIDTMMLVNYPAKNMIANLEGEWAEDIFNVSFSIYSYKSFKWIDGIMVKLPSTMTNKYSIRWDSKHMLMKDTFFSKTMKIFEEKQNNLLAKFYRSSKWYNSIYKYQLNIYSDYLTDAIYFFAVAIADHRYQIYLENQ